MRERSTSVWCGVVVVCVDEGAQHQASNIGEYVCACVRACVCVCMWLCVWCVCV